MFILLLRTFFVQLHFAFYFIDSETYIELFCKNKEKPELECDGKCSLNKVAQETSQKQDRLPENSFSLFFLDFIPSDNFTLNFESFKKVPKKINEFISSIYSFLYFNTLKQPPEGLMI